MSRLTLNNNAADPSAPAAGKLFVYSKTDKKLYIEDDAGLVSQLATGAGEAVIGPASAVDSRIAAFDGATGKLLKDGGILTSALATLAGAQTLTNKTLGETVLPGSGQISSDGWIGLGITPTAPLHVLSSNSPPAIINRTTTGTNSAVDALSIIASTSGDMADLFGARVALRIRDSAGLDNTIARIIAERSGADNTGKLMLSPMSAGVQVDALQILPSGNVGIKTSPLATLHVFTAASGATVSATADDVIIESNTNAGLSILTPDASQGTIYFGTPSDSTGAELAWRYNDNVFNVGTLKVGADLVLRAGNASERARLYSAGDMRQGTGSAIATTATDGFLLIATCAGPPTGIPTNAGAGKAVLIYDETNDKLWVYRGGWKQPKTPAGAAIVTWQ